MDVSRDLAPKILPMTTDKSLTKPFQEEPHEFGIFPSKGVLDDALEAPLT
jgi:hypothetical protein